MNNWRNSNSATRKKARSFEGPARTTTVTESKTLVYEINTKKELTLNYVSDETYESLDSCIAEAEKTDDLFSVLQDVVHSQSPKKRPKTHDLKPIVCVRFRTRNDKKEFKTLKCLIDSGASGSLIAQEYAKDLSLERSKGRHTTWTTTAGDMNTTDCASTLSI